MNLNAYFSRRNAESMADFAQAIGLKSADQVRQWRYGYAGRKPAAETCALIECVSGGIVTCEELRPDLRWLRVPDKKWPHRKGRPVLDVSAAAA